MTGGLHGARYGGGTHGSRPTLYLFCRAGPVCPAGDAGKTRSGRCGERTERCQWQRKRSERVAAVKISSVRHKAAQKFWAPQQDHRPPWKRNKRCNGRATARVAPTKALQEVRYGGPMWAPAPTDGFFGEYPYTISPKRAQVLLSVIFMSRYWPRADLSPTRCTRRPPAVRPERGQRASSVSPSTRQRRVLPT